jgi:hypothetical protein
VQLLIAIVIGLIVGAGLEQSLGDEGFGALVGALIAWLVLRTSKQARTVAMLQ